ncbi:MAG: hypothetical protein M3304_01940, partial [Actinomycetota bacterium]|nr:hypothetical protein [Actinomycetota bacterium]
LERLGRGAGAAVRIAALSLARAPGRAVVAVTFLVVSVALGLFALVYRATLADALADHVAYTFPTDFIVGEDFSVGALVPPLEAAPLSRYEALPGADVVPVLRRQGSVGELSGARRFTLVSLPAEDVRRLDGWRGDFSDVSLAELAERIRPRDDVELRGVAIPRDATEIRLPVAVQRGDPVTLRADVATAPGGFTELPLGTLAGPGVLAAHVPRALRGGALLGLTFGRALAVEGHAQGNVPELTGVARFRPLTVRGAHGRLRIADYREWTRTGALNAKADAGTGRLTYVVTNASATRFRVRQPTDGEPVPIVASPRLAAAADAEGLLSLRLAAGELTTRVVGTAERFPTASGDFVLADERTVATTMNAERPGSASPSEVWISSRSEAALPPLAEALARPPFDLLDVRSRAVYERSVKTEPLVRGTLLTLGAAAAVALALSVVGLVLLLVSELRDERGELFDLEAQGVAPAMLRRHLRLRTLLVLAAGLVGGLAAGLVLSVLVTDLVTLTADATAAEPPLVLRIDWPLVALALAAYATLAGALVATVTRSAFRSRLPEQAVVVT